MSMGDSVQDIQKRVDNPKLEFVREVMARHTDLGIICIEMIVEPMSAYEIIK